MVRVSSRNLHIRALNSYSVSAALGQTYPSAGLLLPTGSQHHNLHTHRWRHCAVVLTTHCQMLTVSFQLLAAHCWPLAALSSTYSPPSSCATEQGSMGKAVRTAAVLCVMSIYWGSCNGIAWYSQYQAQFCHHTASLVLQDILSKPTVTLNTNTQLWASLSCLIHFLSIYRYEMLGEQLKCWNKTEFQTSVSLT